MFQKIENDDGKTKKRMANDCENNIEDGNEEKNQSVPLLTY